AVDVVVVKDLPAGAGGAPRLRGYAGHPPAAGIPVDGEGNLLIEVVFGDILGSGEHPVVFIAVEIDALFPRHLAEGGEQRDAERIVTLVATGLLRLAEIAGMDIIDDAVDAAGAPAAVEIIKRDVGQARVVAKHADGVDA